MFTFGQRLKTLRKEAQLTQSELAEQLGVSVQALSKWECDSTMPDISQIQYLWDGMQTFHWGFYQCLAACYHRLGLKAECREAVDTAYRIVSTAWKDFGENREYYMIPFEEYLAEYDLGEYSRGQK